MDQINNVFYGDIREILGLDLKSIIGDVREFKYYREIVLNLSMVDAAKQNYTIDRMRSRDGAVVVQVRGTLIGRIVNIMTVEADINTRNRSKYKTVTVALETTLTPFIIEFS